MAFINRRYFEGKIIVINFCDERFLALNPFRYEKGIREVGIMRRVEKTRFLARFLFMCFMFSVVAAH